MTLTGVSLTSWLLQDSRYVGMAADWEGIITASVWNCSCLLTEEMSFLVCNDGLLWEHSVMA
jgi:hypothetical protein